jgi:protein SCO1/2
MMKMMSRGCEDIPNRTRCDRSLRSRSGSLRRAVIVAAVTMVAVASVAQAQFWTRKDPPPNPMPPEAVVQEVSLDQKLDSQVPLELPFRDESGRPVKLAHYFGSRPVVLTMNYYECPMLCTQVLNGLTSALKVMTFDVGKEFDVVTVSIDPKETSKMAAEKKAAYVKRYGRAGAETGWHFLTGDSAAIKRLADAVGFRFVYDPKSGQYAHASGVIVLTPQGKVSRYFYGVEYSPVDLRRGLVESGEGKIGSPVEKMVLLCYMYDPVTGKYGLAVTRIMQLLGIVTVVGLGGFVILMMRRERRRAGGLVADARLGVMSDDLKN